MIIHILALANTTNVNYAFHSTRLVHVAANVTPSLHIKAELKVRHSADSVSVTHTHTQCPDCDASGVAGSITKGT